MDLSNIKDQKLINRIYEIARTDRGENPEEIDSDKGIQDLGILLSKGFNGRQLTNTEKNAIKGLCIEYQSQSGLNNFAYEGDNITVSGNNNNTVGRISNSNVVVGNNNQITINNINQKNKTANITSSSKVKGAVLAKQLFNETVNSLYAYNDKMVNIIRTVDDKTAYSFFKEYQRLSNDKSNIIQDIYNVSDIFNRITLDETSHLINSLLSQAKPHLKNNDAYINLEKYIKNIENKRNKDPTKNESIELDYAIQTLLDEMAKTYGDNK